MRVRTWSSSNWLQEYFFHLKDNLIRCHMFARVLFSDLGPENSSVVTTRCGFQEPPRLPLLSSPSFALASSSFLDGIYSSVLFFFFPPIVSFSFFNHRSVHAWIEMVKSASNARSKLSERSYQFHGSQANGINLYHLRDTRIFWPKCKLHWPWNNFTHIWWLRSHIKVLLKIFQVNDCHLWLSSLKG